MIRTLTYNIRLGIETHLAEIAGVVERARPDLVAFQEIGVNWQMGERVDQPAWIAERAGLPHHCFAGALTDAEGGRFGVALASRWPLEDPEEIWLPRINDEQRVLLHATLQTPSGPVHTLTTHLAILKERRERELQASVIGEFVATLDGPVILCGDLNDRPDTRTVTLTRGVLTDCFDARGQGAEVTFSVADPHRRIDYVFCGGGLEPAGPCRVLTDEIASDHFPLFATCA